MPKPSTKEKKKNLKKEVLAIIDNRITLWRSHGDDAPLAPPHSNLTLVGELEVIRKTIEDNL